MSEIIAVVGQTGTGKSTAVETLDSKETVIIGIIDKPLPFRYRYSFEANRHRH